MRALVIGAGGVGLGIASCLFNSGHQVDIAGRQTSCDSLAQHGLARTGIFGEYHASSGTFGTFPGIPRISPTPYDYLLVCVKSFDSEPVARELADHPSLVSPDTRIVLLQNGYGNFEIFSALFPPEQIFIARVITGFRLLDRHHVEITVHAAPIHIGSPLPGRSDAVADLCTAISQGGIPTEVSQCIEADLWAKILYNAMLNPLGAIFGATYGELGASEHTRSIMGRIAAEAFAVMRTSGHSTHWPGADPFLEAFYGQMLPPTRDHESSMLQSIRAGRRTEIDALNGALVALGKEHQVPTPVNETVVTLLRFLESRQQPSI